MPLSTTTRTMRGRLRSVCRQSPSRSARNSARAMQRVYNRCKATACSRNRRDGS